MRGGVLARIGYVLYQLTVHHRLYFDTAHNHRAAESGWMPNHRSASVLTPGHALAFSFLFTFSFLLFVCLFFLLAPATYRFSCVLQPSPLRFLFSLPDWFLLHPPSEPCGTFCVAVSAELDSNLILSLSLDLINLGISRLLPHWLSTQFAAHDCPINQVSEYTYSPDIPSLIWLCSVVSMVSKESSNIYQS